MALFGRKKEEEIEEEFDEETNFSRRKLRDLNPQNKKKRKEPPKPWGRRERLIILIILVITMLISGTLLFLSDNKSQLPILNFQFSKPDFSSLNIFKEQTIIIPKK